ncbi:MAG: cobalamin-independent methionine synthase II family protein [Candidatus Promineifilaceae bacterium]|nr:cobalamin-independent methionine synthase II family protein [Candidatus Promineifilaceae bacterium]
MRDIRTDLHDVHADVVGSLLRTPELLQAQQELEAGRLTQAAFKVVEDRAVDEAIALQEEAGMPVVTDGEQRRLSFQSQLPAAVEGFGEWDIDAFLWGDWKGDEEVGDWSRERPRQLGVTGKLRRKRHLSVEEFVYLRGRTTRIPKITLPSPSLWVNFWSPEHSGDAYPTLDSFLADVVDILREEVEELVRLGATYIQIDAPHYPLLLDRRTREFYESQGWTVEQYLQRGIEMDNAVIGDFPNVTFSFHLCRGNQGSRWLAEGGYELISKPIFRGIKADRLMLEYDDERSGTFEPLQDVPDDKMVVLGLVTTKSPRRETVDGLSQQIEEAANYFPREQLALSPQCGFATSVVGNALDVDDEAYKLRTIVEAAEAVWG